MTRCVVFDFDGTLVDSNDIKRESYYDTVAGFENGAAILDEIFAAGNAGDRFEVLRKFAARLGDDSFADPLTQRYSSRCEELIAGCDEIPGASECLRNLRAFGKRIFVISATPQLNLRPILRRRGLDRLIDGSFGGPRSKVDNLRSVLSAEGVPPEDATVVGDGDDDEHAALVVGCAFVAVDSLGRHNPARRRWVPNLLGLADLLA
jgi:phosphoglycolate phosphatase-like HAD superfamily hydrolase